MINKGYSIPFIDLAGDKSRQITVDRQPRQYLGHPTTVLLEDGKTIITVYPKGHGAGALVMKRSKDGGLTWQDRQSLPESFNTSLEVPTIHRTIDPSTGKKRLLIFSGAYPIRSSVSEDDGYTWSELAPIGDFGGIVAMSDMIRLKNGDYMALFHDDGRFIKGGSDIRYQVIKHTDDDNEIFARITYQSADNGRTWSKPAFWREWCNYDDSGIDWDKAQVVYETYSAKRPVDPDMIVYKSVSSDGGLNWSSPQIVTSHPEAHLCEPGVFRSPDGSRIAVIMRENSRKYNSFAVFSDDEGQTWSKPAELPGALTGDRHCGKYTKDGRLVISFRDMTHESDSKGDWVAWIGRFEDIVNGNEGQYRVRLMKNNHDDDCAYPGVEVLPDGTVVTVTYGHWEKGEKPYIACVRFKPEDIDRAWET